MNIMLFVYEIMAKNNFAYPGIYSKMFEQKIFELKESFERVQMSQSYEATFSSLWYGSLPCSGVAGITGVYKFTDQVAVIFFLLK